MNKYTGKENIGLKHIRNPISKLSKEIFFFHVLSIQKEYSGVRIHYNKTNPDPQNQKQPTKAELSLKTKPPNNYEQE